MMDRSTPGSGSNITLVVADDHPLVLDSLRSLFEYLPWIDDIRLARDGLELCEITMAAGADAAVVDLSMPRLDGLSSIRRLRRRHPHIAIVAITGAEHWFPENEVRQAGADEYLSKHRDGEEVVGALARALAAHGHQVAHAPDVLRDGKQPQHGNLTGREREVLKLLAEGYGINESARLLHVSAATIRKHREHIYAKLATSNTAKLTLIAVRTGLVQG